MGVKWTEKQFADFEKGAIETRLKRTGRAKVDLPILKSVERRPQSIPASDKGIVAVFDITPNTKPRTTVRDKWLNPPRPCVAKYYKFAAELRELAKKKGYKITDTLNIEFHLPMPDSWSKKKKAKMNGQPHQQTPDLDNMCKAFADCLTTNDCSIHSIQAKKVWGETGQIILYF